MSLFDPFNNLWDPYFGYMIDRGNTGGNRTTFEIKESDLLSNPEARVLGSIKHTFEKKDGKYQLYLDVPGFNKKDVSVELVNHYSEPYLYVRGNKKINGLRRTVDVSIKLDSDLNTDSIEVELNDGLLLLTALPKLTKPPGPRKIEIK